MVKILTIIGARPQIIKAAAVSRAIRNFFTETIQEIIVHTGQHYDDNMSQIFIEQLQIPSPHYNLGIGSASHGIQTARMIEKIENVLLIEKPDFVLLYGDTNSTLAGAIAGAKIHIPVVHVEAGLRSFNKLMPEEINRIVCDHCSTLLFSPTSTGFQNLVREGFLPNAQPPYHINNPKIYHCGDVMYDNCLYFADMAETNSQILQQYGLSPEKFILTTIHRDSNTDQPQRLEAIFSSLIRLTQNTQLPIVLPIHPRTSKVLKSKLQPETYKNIQNQSHILIIPPASFFDMMVLEKNAALILTDSGGVQKEAYFYRKPCVILRAETEWKEIVETGAAALADANEEKILSMSMEFLMNPPRNFPPIFGDGKAGRFILNEIIGST
ncbi:MAG TPA: UDP-N-acetylglucosamine 2-epimerase (non-hydrolyzing) [Bacteroidales bacterium]|jgi:UDP-GlcNAc3NAcA epimerase|nr:UDP-N-acetylglucosamine 2-epimerase (non-hydrolyzing) [Bacteroidales bacterium]